MPSARASIRRVWNNGTDNLAQVTFSQNGVTKSFFTRQNTKKFDVIYNDLQAFQPGSISYFIQSAQASSVAPLVINSPWVSSAVQNITATAHTYSETHQDLMTYDALPETLTGPGNTHAAIALTVVLPDR